MGLYNNLINNKLLRESLYSTESFYTYDTKTGQFKILPIPLPKISILDKEECLKEFQEELYQHGYYSNVEGDKIHVWKLRFSTSFELGGLFPYSYVLICNLNKAYKHFKGEL